MWTLLATEDKRKGQLQDWEAEGARVIYICRLATVASYIVRHDQRSDNVGYSEEPPFFQRLTVKI
jgi:hypothetical protein